MYLSHPTQLRDIRDKLLALPISYLHFITGVRVICTLCRRIGNFLLSRHVAVEKVRVVGEQVQVRGGQGKGLKRGRSDGTRHRKRRRVTSMRMETRHVFINTFSHTLVRGHVTRRRKKLTNFSKRRDEGTCLINSGG